MNKKIMALLLLMIFSLLSPFKIWALGEGQLKRIATGGFGDSANSYTWGLTEFNGDVYASTVRHHLWSIMQAMPGLLPDGDFPIDPTTAIEGPADPVWGSPGYAAEMRGQIWRLKDGIWEKVYQSMTFELPYPIIVPDYGLTIPAGTYPVAYGYRTLGTFNGHIYALGVGTWMPPMPFSSIVRSATGNEGDWQDVSGPLANTTNVRGFVEWQGKVYVSASKPGTDLGSAGGCVVFSSPDGENWSEMSEIGFGNQDNVEIYYLSVFDDHLYASTVNYVTGFEVWKTDGTEEDGKLVWTPVVVDGFGDTWNQYGMTMQPFGEYLYIGSAVGIGMVMKDGEPVGTRPIDIIRVDKDDKAELMVGAYFPSDPPPGWPTFRIPKSYIPAGFGNPFNGYAWHMAVYKGELVVGTLDMSGTILRNLKELLIEDPQAAADLVQNITDTSSPSTMFPLQILNQIDFQDGDQVAVALKLIDYLIKKFGGADLWKTKNGIDWEPVTLSGFKNSLNYGIRRTVPIVDEKGREHLYIGTANPFTGYPNGGCEVLATPPVKIK
ncbi:MULTISPECIES: hypothetical protein [Desulfosediminicola]|uniref:hypothetical protein n=1 Tax=Desulfosediminicola TaxID=2886823 RepID=UPI0010AD376E|nr:hypothetical protein [Desulfosediminicola ganghwensis]